MVPLDHKIVDRTTPIIYITGKRLLFYHDNVVETYQLKNITFGYSGEEPQFKIWRILLDFKYKYSNNEDDDFLRLMRDQYNFRFTFNETGKATKDFLHRNYESIMKSYQTWAMGRIIMNHKNNIPIKNDLIEMINGDFVVFNQRAVLIFAFITTIYFLMRWLLIPLVPDIFQTIIDGLYIALLLLMGVWLYLSYQKNLKRYENIYRSFTIDTASGKNNVTNQVK